jgi:hypothetical protein
LLLAKQSLDEAPYKLSGAVAKLVGITFGRLSPSYWIDYLGFITEGKTCCYIHQTLLLGFYNWPVIYYTQSSFLTSSSPRHHREASKHHLLRYWLFPTGSINLGFLLRENLLLCSSYLPLGVPNWAVIYINTAPQSSCFLAPLLRIEEE